MPDLTYDKEALRGLGSGLHDLGDRITQDGGGRSGRPHGPASQSSIAA